jgi:hypothetical protein
MIPAVTSAKVTAVGHESCRRLIASTVAHGTEIGRGVRDATKVPPVRSVIVFRVQWEMSDEREQASSECFSLDLSPPRYIDCVQVATSHA